MTIFKSILFLLISLFCALDVHAQNKIIVSDSNTLLPLELVTVESINSAKATVTNKNGQFDLSLFSKTDTLKFRRLGYKTRQIPVFEISGKKVIYLREDFISDYNLVVSASRWKEKSTNTSSRITVIKASDLQAGEPQTVADALTQSGQVFVQKSQMGGGSPMIRGFATNRVLISIDGVRMNNAIFRSGNIQNIINLDPFVIDQAEILFGTGSVMYGSDAIGGVMDFSTIPAEFSRDSTLAINSGYQSRWSSANNEFTNHVKVKLANKYWSYVGALTYFDFQDLRMGSNGPDEYLRTFLVNPENGIDQVSIPSNQRLQTPTAYNQFNAFSKYRSRVSNYIDMEYTVHYSSTSTYPRYDRLIQTRNGEPRSAVWNYGPQKWFNSAYSLRYYKPNRYFDDAVLRTSYQVFEESRIDRSFQSENQRTRKEKVDAYIATLDFSKTLFDADRLTYGFEIVVNDVQSNATETNINTNTQSKVVPRYPESIWSTSAGFFQYRHVFTDQLKLNLGARYTFYSIRSSFDTDVFSYPFERTRIFDHAISGSMGLIYNPIQKFTVGLTLSSGFRAPNVDDIGKVFDSEPGNVIVPNPDLQAEHAYNAEIGFSHIVSDVFKWDVTAYTTFLDQALSRRSYSINGTDSIMYDGLLSGVQAIQNASYANVYGIQSHFDAILPLNIKFSGSYSWQYGTEELEDGTRDFLRHISPSFGNLDLRYSNKGIAYGLNLLYNGEIPFSRLAQSEINKAFLYANDANGNPYSPAWFTLNSRIDYSLNKNWGFTLALENIFDIRYRPYSSGLVAPGRNVIISVKARV